MGLFNLNKKSNDDTMLDLPATNEPPMPGEGPEILNPFDDNNDNGMSVPEVPQGMNEAPPFPGNQNEGMGDIPMPQAPAPQAPAPQAPAPQAPTSPMNAESDDMIPPAPTPIEPMSGMSNQNKGLNAPPPGLGGENADIPEFPTFADKFGTKPSEQEEDMFGSSMGDSNFPEDLSVENQEEGSNPNSNNENEIDDILGSGSQADEDNSSFSFGVDPASQLENNVEEPEQEVVEEQVTDNNLGLFKSDDMADPLESQTSINNNQEKDEDQPFTFGGSSQDAKVEEVDELQENKFSDSKEETVTKSTNYVKPKTVSQDIIGPVYCSMDRCESMASNVIIVKETVKDLEKRILLAVENEKELAKLYAEWKKDIEFIQSKLFTVDKKIFA